MIEKTSLAIFSVAIWLEVMRDFTHVGEECEASSV